MRVDPMIALRRNPRINCVTLDFGRRSPRKSIRRPADAAAGPLSAAVSRRGGRVAVFLLLQSIAQVAGPLLTKLAIDRYLAQTGPSRFIRRSTAGSRTTVDRAGADFRALSGGGADRLRLRIRETYLMQRTGQLAMFDLRRELMEQLQRSMSPITTAIRWAD